MFDDVHSVNIPQLLLHVAVDTRSPHSLSEKRVAEGPDILYVSLIEALRVPGCPICHLVIEVRAVDKVTSI